MRNHKITLAAAILILSISISGIASGRPRRGENLHYMVKAKQPIYVHLNNFVNSSESDRINPGRFKRAVGEALKRRNDMHFELVEDPAEADISINGEIREYTYSGRDPIDMFIGTWAIALDMLRTENYVGLVINYNVSDAKTGKILWSKRSRPSITRSDMPEEESTPLIIKKAAKLFVSKCFGRPKKRPPY